MTNFVDFKVFNGWVRQFTTKNNYLPHNTTPHFKHIHGLLLERHSNVENNENS